jgi:hypothetical protein
MDPYIESSGRWRDFHVSMIAAMRGALNSRLPEGYVASSELYVWFHEPRAEERVHVVAPDVYVTQTRSGQRVRAAQARGRGSTAVASPTKIVLPGAEPKQHRFLEVRDIQSERVVTVIELLSPTNKSSGDGREAYLAKRNQHLAADPSFVEIDLLRGGQRLPLSSSAPRVQDYYVMVSRSWQRPRADLWTFGVRDRLPEVPVPLTRRATPVSLSLRDCVDRAYDEGRYAALLNYNEPLVPHLSEQDEAWLRGIFASPRRRKR